MKIFLDTSALIAYFNVDDRYPPNTLLSHRLHNRWGTHLPRMHTQGV